MPTPGADPHHFDFDLDRGIREQVVEKLENSPFFPLAKDVGPHASGIYALYFRGKLAYVGKASKETTKSKRTLRARLNEHLRKIGEAEAERRILISQTCSADISLSRVSGGSSQLSSHS